MLFLPGLGSRASAATDNLNLFRPLKIVLKRGLHQFGSGLKFQLIFRIAKGWFLTHGCRALDLIQNLILYHYFRCVFLAVKNPIVMRIFPGIKLKLDLSEAKLIQLLRHTHTYLSCYYLLLLLIIFCKCVFKMINLEYIKET